MGIELDTENSCMKYQVCKPVAPQTNRNRSDSVAVCLCFDRIVVAGGAATKSAPYVADSRKNTIPATK